MLTQIGCCHRSVVVVAGGRVVGTCERFLLLFKLCCTLCYCHRYLFFTTIECVHQQHTAVDALMLTARQSVFYVYYLQ